MRKTCAFHCGPYSLRDTVDGPAIRRIDELLFCRSENHKITLDEPTNRRIHNLSIGLAEKPTTSEIIEKILTDCAVAKLQNTEINKELQSTKNKFIELDKELQIAKNRIVELDHNHPIVVFFKIAVITWCILVFASLGFFAGTAFS